MVYRDDLLRLGAFAVIVMTAWVVAADYATQAAVYEDAGQDLDFGAFMAGQGSAVVGLALGFVLLGLAWIIELLHQGLGRLASGSDAE